VPKLLKGLKAWLQSMGDGRASAGAVGDVPEKRGDPLDTSAEDNARLRTAAIVGVFSLLVFYFLFFASPILIPIRVGDCRRIIRHCG
jgi:hypothetical protein